MPQSALEIAQKLIQCRSVTPEAGSCFSYLEELLGPLGFEVHRVTFSDHLDTPNVENMFAKLSSFQNGGPHLTFAGHVDVVPSGLESLWSVPPFEGVVKDGNLYGRGAVDMKGGLASFLAAVFQYLEKHGPIKGTLSLLVTADEEGPAINGTKKLLEWATQTRGETFEAAVVGEPTNPHALGEAIKVGRRGSQTGHITIEGTQGHVAYPHLANNPIPVLAKAVTHIGSLTMDDGTQFFQPSHLEFVNIHVGNMAANVIPQSAKARFNCRFNDLWDKDKIRSFVEKALDECQIPEGFKVGVQLEPETSQVFLTRTQDLISSFSACVQEVTGREPQLSTAGGTSDARYIKDYCPVIEFGLVGLTMHQIDEHVPVKDLEELTEIYYRFICRYFATEY